MDPGSRRFIIALQHEDECIGITPNAAGTWPVDGQFNAVF